VDEIHRSHAAVEHHEIELALEQLIGEMLAVDVDHVRVHARQGPVHPGLRMVVVGDHEYVLHVHEALPTLSTPIRRAYPLPHRHATGPSPSGDGT
jgi:hypothetical protein